MEPEAWREAGDALQGGDRDGDWDLGSSGKHPRETQKPSLGAGEEERERWQALEEE